MTIRPSSIGCRRGKSGSEDRSVRFVLVATVDVVSGADAQAKGLGAVESAVYVEHPIQDRTDDEMRAIADGAVEGVVRGLIGGD